MHLPEARLAVFLVSCSIAVSAAAPMAAQKLNRRDVEKLIAEADKFAAEGQLAEARQRLNPVVQQDPTNVPVALKLAKICETLKDWDCAGSAYQMAASNAKGPEKADAHAGLAAGHLHAGRFPDAAENARAAIAINPSLAGAHVTLAASLVRQGARDALPATQKAVELAPSSDVAHMAHGQALAVEGKPAEAEAAFRKVLELQPKSAEAHAWLAELQLRRKDYDGTIASADAAMGIDKTLTHLYSVRGRAHDAKGNEDQAISDLQTAVAMKAEDKDAQLALGHIYFKRKNYDLAITHYKNAAALDVQMGDAHLGLADAMVARRDFDAAREPVERVAAALPQSARAQYLLGTLREHQRQYDEAIKAYQQAASLDAKLAGAHLGLGRILREHKKDPANALVSLEKAAALDPDNPDVLSELGVSLYETKQPDRAIQTLQKAVATPKYENPLGFAVLGFALKDRGSFGDAVGHFEKAVELAPKWSLPHWGAAWSHFGLIKKGCPCGPADEERVKKMKAHYDAMTALGQKDAQLEARVDALSKGQKIK